MPDANGRFKGISIPCLPWLEDKRPPKPGPKNVKRDTTAKLK